ncbi:MAG TPA: GMC oxidoreductase [Nocardioidaceae bacterium]|nr:GMC oxidoreductase [Nocardioidaceae bacterium]
MPAHQASEHTDVVVVGSGFGGSVAAYRMAEDGRSVVVLERGRAYPPGSFARTPAEMARNFWEPAEGQHGLFDIWTFDGLEGIVSSGLGGGSLIYANVLLRKDEKWFVHESPLPGGGYEHWPISRAQLETHYDAVEQMIGANRYPYTDTPKTEAMREAAAGLGLDFQTPPLAISFARRPGEPPVARAELPTPAYGNVHGLPRLTCRGCGECNLGCNDGSKNTMDHTYLSAAQHLGADLRTRHEVKGFRPLAGGGYEVTYAIHTGAHGEKATGLPTLTITCERLILAAGTFGTSYLLLRNVSAFPGMSSTLGSRFSGNGDLLGLLFGATKEGRPRAVEGSRGPVITTAIRIGDAADGDGSTGRGFYVEDAGYPGFTDWLAESTQAGAAVKRAGRFALKRIRERITDSADSSIGADLGELLGDGALSSTSLPLLGMGRDIPDGVLHLEEGRLAAAWTTETSLEYFEGVRRTMQAIGSYLGASYHDNPLWLGKRVITVHPLGGAPMARQAAEGVCDEYGEVFGYPGLHVMDGALLPGPVGANPSLTIAAVADRCCTHIVESSPRGSLLSGAPAAEPPRSAPVAVEPLGVSFTEQMKGFVALGVTDPAQGFEQGRAAGDRLMFELTISTNDVDRFVQEAEHEGNAVGYVESDVLGGRFDVERGWFNLFVERDDPTSRQMLYRLWLSGPGGNPMTFTGVKRVHDDPGFDLWRDTSTLYVHILEGHVLPGDEGPVAAAGIITIHLPDFAKQLTTFRSHGPRRVHGLEAFGRLFLGQLWDVYGKAFADKGDS